MFDEQKEVVSFFACVEDAKLQKMILDGGSFDIEGKALQYVTRIVHIPIDSFVEYIKKIKREPIFASDVFQFSDFSDATVNLSFKIKKYDNKGLNYLEAGKLLLDDGVNRTDIAYRKYGENHIKMALAIGLVFKANDAYYLSPIGCVFDDLDEETKNKLLVRLLLRNKLVSQLLLEASKRAFDMEAFLYELSESTYQRRRSNVKYILSIINNCSEYDFSAILNNIKY